MAPTPVLNVVIFNPSIQFIIVTITSRLGKGGEQRSTGPGVGRAYSDLTLAYSDLTLTNFQIQLKKQN